MALALFPCLIAAVSHSQEVQGFIQPDDQLLIFLHVLACERQSQEGTDEIGDVFLRDGVGVLTEQGGHIGPILRSLSRVWPVWNSKQLQKQQVAH